MDYKTTLNLPKTSFPMKGNLAQSEPKVIAQWDKERLYQKLLAQRKGAPSFILHDGPPYANGDIHMGHALNKILKDIIVRYKSVRGNFAPYIPGWDCHGLPIEYALMKELKVTKHQVNIVDFRKKARAYAKKYVGIQRDQFKRLGVQGDWDNPYLTLAPEYVSSALNVLSSLVRKDFIYRARKPVNWCWSCETALAEAEVEYENRTSPSIYVKFELDPDSVRKLIPVGLNIQAAHLVIWTTTPWTLMGNVAVAVHPDAEYAVWKGAHGQAWVTLLELTDASRKALGFDKEHPQLFQKLRGSELEGLQLQYQHPFGLRKGKVVIADYVSAEDGTGLVHTAPGFGAEDYATGKKYNLEVFAPVDSQGKFIGLPTEVSQFNGRQVQQTNPLIIELLKNSGHLIQAKEFEHSYPHCWRCHNPIIFRATDQWFLKIDHENLRQRLLDVVENQVQWIPPVGKERMAGMITTRPDWCLSRQRLWGIPIPAVICKKCGEGILDPTLIENFSQAIEKDPEGSDKWFSEEVSRWFPKDFTCRCGGKTFERGTDILDVWFDSGVSHEGVLKRRAELQKPADMYLEGSDQHRGWFQVSLMTGVALEGKAPYRSVLTHGFVVDGDGRKMSKSVGNVIAPEQVISSMGADLLRLWVASSDYAEDIRLSQEILSQTAETYRKIRNTIRFCLSNISDFDVASSKVPVDQMEQRDRWILSQLGILVRDVTQSYDQYAFHRAVKAIHEFCAARLSNFYLDVIKDPLYTSPPKDARRRSIQTALFHIAHTLIVMMGPICPMTMEEAWAALNGAGHHSVGSVHLQLWPDAKSFPVDAALEESWSQLLHLRDEVMKALEKAREAQEIGDALEAELEVTVREDSLWRFLESRVEQLSSACIVSVLKIKHSTPPGPPVEFRVVKSAGAKCERCWMRLNSVGQSKEHPSLCHRCVAVVENLV